MQPPIPVDTILQNRYRILNILGQGGFGRTYLAEDQGRFQELCALKELIPPQDSAYALEKAQELFQREAATLYQIQHPQIPQFRATFEQDGRLFLIQDYVAGKTYHTLLNERKVIGQTFSQTEVFQLLEQMLPVLGHIHNMGIIHRDISPDNIIRRESDGLPVLIDFGVVKELATRFQSPHSGVAATTVGKLGYAPSEQMQTGRAYPNSDLYALAVTAIVLLTGKEPPELFDDTTLIWRWRQWANVSDPFAQVLQRMLSYRPSDRYQSAHEVIQALITITPAPVFPIPSYSPPPPATPDLSEIRTVAVGGQVAPINPHRNQPERVIPEPREAPIWEDTGVIFAVGTFLALLAGVGSWGLVTTLLSRQQPQPSPIPTVPTITANPTPTFSATPTPTTSPTPLPERTTYTRSLNLTPGTTVSEEGDLANNVTINYVISGEQGQQLDTYLKGQGVLMTILGADQNPIDEQAQRVLGWKGILPASGNYTIQLRTIRGVREGSYQLNISLANPVVPTETPTTTPTDIETPTPIPTPTDIETPTPTPTDIETPVPSETPTSPEPENPTSNQ